MARRYCFSIGPNSHHSKLKFMRDNFLLWHRWAGREAVRRILNCIRKREREREILRVQKIRRLWQREIWRKEDRADIWEGECSKEFQLKTKTSPRRFMCFLFNWGSQNLPVILYNTRHVSNNHPRMNGRSVVFDEGSEASRVLALFELVHLSLYLWEKLAKWVTSSLPACLSSDQCSGRFRCTELFEYDKLLIKVLKLVIKKGLSRECSNSSVENS